MAYTPVATVKVYYLSHNQMTTHSLALCYRGLTCRALPCQAWVSHPIYFSWEWVPLGLCQVWGWRPTDLPRQRRQGFGPRLHGQASPLLHQAAQEWHPSG